jgi:protein involved in polysaccharide export with SLBB domain
MVVAITDLQGPGSETFKQAQVAQDGNIALTDPLGTIRAQGLTPRELERAIAQRIREKRLVHNAQVTVTFPEPRRAGDAVLPAPVAPELEKLLRKRIPEVRLQGTPLSDVIDFLRDTTGANIFVNWKVLEGVGIERNAPVTLRFRDVSFDKVLRLVLEEVGGGNVALAYIAEENVITISTEEDLAREPKAGQVQAAGEYYVSGIERPGTYALSGPIKLSQALIAAGGKGVAGKYVIVVRRSQLGSERMPFAIDDLIHGRVPDMLVEKGDVLMVTEKPAATQPTEHDGYRIDGDVPRPGTYALPVGRQLNVLQALISAGANPPDIEDKWISVYRDGRLMYAREIRAAGTNMLIHPGDRVVVGDKRPAELDREP